MKLYAYTDGSYNRATNRCGYGVVFADEIGNRINALYGGFTPKPDENGWNINGELRAAEEAVRAAEQAGADELVIRHDLDGVGMWATGRWKRNKTYTIAYAQFMQEASARIKLSFESVKGHSGNPMNNVADREARKGAEQTDDVARWEDPTAWERLTEGREPAFSEPESGTSVPEDPPSETAPQTVRVPDSNGCGKNSATRFEILTRLDGEPFEAFIGRVAAKADEIGATAEIRLPSELRAVIFSRTTSD